MILQRAATEYDSLNEQETRDALQAADDQNVKKGQDIILRGGRANTRDPRIVIYSPNGSAFTIAIADDGSISSVAL